MQVELVVLDRKGDLSSFFHWFDKNFLFILPNFLLWVLSFGLGRCFLLLRGISIVLRGAYGWNSFSPTFLVLIKVASGAAKMLAAKTWRGRENGRDGRGWCHVADERFEVFADRALRFRGFHRTKNDFTASRTAEGTGEIFRSPSHKLVGDYTGSHPTCFQEQMGWGPPSSRSCTHFSCWYVQKYFPTTNADVIETAG